MKKDKKWFSIIEILIWIFIFSIWLWAIYMLIISTMKLNDYSKNSIIASNLARESIELVKNIRDSNYKNYYKWNSITDSTFFKTWAYYKVENNFSSAWDRIINIQEITDFWEWKSEIMWKMQNYRLCLDREQRYTYDCITSWNRKTIFYRYLKIDDVKYNSWWIINIDNALKITSKVIWYNNSYHEVELKTILTDFLRQ